MLAISWCRRSARVAAALAVAGFLSLATAHAQGIIGGCLEEESPIGINCVSGDVTFAILGTGLQTDGCVDEGFGFCTPEGDPSPDPNGEPCTLGGNECPPGEECRALDELTVFLRGQAENETAQTRYDVGLWGAIDGDPNGDGARSGACVRTFIANVGACAGGTNMNFPCRFDSECPGSTCNLALADTCPPLDLVGNDPLPPPPNPPGPANGPFLEVEGDRCGDLFDGGQAGCDENSDGLWDPTIIDFANAVTLPCSDLDESGFVDFQTCASWGNQEDEVALGSCVGGTSPGAPCASTNDCSGGGASCVGRGICIGGASQGAACLADADCPSGTCLNDGGLDTCESAADVFNGTPSKCSCSEADSQIPNPNLDLACSLPNRCTFQPGLPCDDDTDCTGGMGDVCVSQPSTVAPNSEVLLAIDFDNPAAANCPGSTCPGLPAERLECGTASFIRFDLTDQMGTGTFVTTPLPTPQETTGGAVTVIDPELVRWDPDSGCGTANVIGAGDAGTALVSYRVGPTAPDSVTVLVQTIWSDQADFDPNAVQALQATCPINVQQTWASVAGVRAYEAAGSVVLEWRTTSEVDTRGFNAYRLDRGAQRRIPLADGLVQSQLRSEGSAYRVIDPQGRPGELAEYLLVEQDLYGHRRAIGPFVVEVGLDAPALATAGDLGLGARPPLPSLAELRRLETSLHEADASTQGRPAAGGAQLKITAESTGIYRVGADQIAGAWGISLAEAQAAIAGGRLALSNRGAQVAWSPAGDASALFFYAQAVDDPFSRFNVYWLAAESGAQAATVSGGSPAPQPGGSFAESLRLETQSFAATTTAKKPDVDYWFWEGLLAPASKDFAVTVPDVLAGAPAELTARLYSATDYPVEDEHTAIARVNGVEVGQATWDNIRFHEATFSVPAGVLAAGANQIQVEAVLGGGVPVSAFFVDRFTVAYPRLYRAVGDVLAFAADGHSVVTVEGFSNAAISVFEVSDPAAPRVVSDLTIDADGGGFRASFAPAAPDAVYVATTLAAMKQPAAVWADVPSDLAGSTGAEWVIVAPAQLASGAQTLADHRGRRFSTLVVDVEDVYDEFAHGLATPLALRDFVAHAWNTWAERPQFVVLAGAGTFDYKDYQGLGGNLVPPLLVDTPSGLFASDIAYGDVAGDDGIPEVAIGRIPALTQAELATYVTKVRAVERSGGPDWRGSALLVADNADDAGAFADDSDSLAPRLPGNYLVDKAYLGDLSAPEVRQRLIDAFNRGTGFVNYLGHGGVTQFADEALLTVADAALLTGIKRPAVAASLTCVAGRFEYPGIQSLAEALVLANGGAVAMWAPSGLSYHVDAARLNQLFVDAAFASGATVGSAVHDAFAAYEESGFFRHLLYIYNVFGDPAVKAR